MEDKIIITAGYGKAKNALAIAELLTKRGYEISSIIVVNPFNINRLRKEIRTKGKWFIKNGLKKIFNSGKEISLLNNFIKEHNIELKSLKDWAKENNSDYLLTDNINSDEVIEHLESEKPNWLIYGGGGIIKGNLIKTMEGKILNAHSGPMPEIRGMNAIEWTILLGYKPSITLHFIDEGIDTGKILLKKEVVVERGDTIPSIRDKAVITGINAMVEFFDNKEELLDKSYSPQNSKSYRQCFVLSTLLREHLTEKLISDAK